jgi:hypothetical protein
MSWRDYEYESIDGQWVITIGKYRASGKTKEQAYEHCMVLIGGGIPQ